MSEILTVAITRRFGTQSKECTMYNVPRQVKQVRTKSGFKRAYAKCSGDMNQ